jgi:hypothetical protein
MRTTRNTIIVCLLFIAASHFAARAADMSPAQIRALTEEATIWGYPIVENYKATYFYAVLKESPKYGGWNTLHHDRRVYTPDDRFVVSPNNDTPYSGATLDLRAEPFVLSVPDVGDRYYTFQLVDMVTDNFAYIGTRATGNKAGRFALAGPDWKGTLPEGVKLIRCPSYFVGVLGRTQLKGPDDLKNVMAVQDQCALMPLSKLTGEKPRPVEPVDFPAYSEKSVTTLELFRTLNWGLQYLSPDPEDLKLLARFAAIGIAPGKAFDPAALDEAKRKAMEAGLAAGLAKIRARADRIGRTVNGWDLAPTGVPYFGHDYMFRAAYAMKAIYVNSPEEAYYPAANLDANGDPLDGSKHCYAIRFQKGQLPPARYFWSLTMYRKSDGLLVENPIRRYSIGDRTTGLKLGGDGSLVMYLQHNSPGADQESNWLPAPSEPFYVLMRIYGPSASVLNGKWTPPPVERVK